MATRGRRASPDVPRGVARAQCVARDASRRDSRAHARGDARARGRAIAPASRANTTTTTATTSPRRRAPPTPPFVAPSTIPSPSRRATRSRRRLRSRNARARGRGCERAPVGRRRHPGGRTPVDERPGRGSLRRGLRSPPRRRRPKPLRRRRPKTSSPPPSPPPPPPPDDFRARGPHDVSRRAVTFYWPALLRQAEPRVPRVGSLRPRSSTAPRRRRRAPSAPSPSSPSAWAGTAGRSVTIEPSPTSRRTVSSSYRPPSPIVAPTPRPSASSPTTSARVSIGPRARRVDRTHPVRSDRSIPTRTVRSFQRRGRGGARRDGRDARGGPGPGPGPSALAGVGAFSASAGVDLDALSAIRDVAVFQVAGQRDSHVTPRAVARSGGRDGPRVAAGRRRREGRHALFPRRGGDVRVPSVAVRRREGGGGRGRVAAALARGADARHQGIPRGVLRGDSREGPEDRGGGTRKIFSFADEGRRREGARGRLGSGKTRGSWWNRKRRCGGGGEGGDAASGSEGCRAWRYPRGGGGDKARRGGSRGMREVLVPKKKRSCRP